MDLEPIITAGWLYDDRTFGGKQNCGRFGNPQALSHRASNFDLLPLPHEGLRAHM